MDVVSRGQDHLKGKLSGAERRIRMLEAPHSLQAGLNCWVLQERGGLLWNLWTSRPVVFAFMTVPAKQAKLKGRVETQRVLQVSLMQPASDLHQTANSRRII